MDRDGNKIAFFFNDLTKEAQKSLVEFLGDNGNYDVFPLLTITKTEDDQLLFNEGDWQ